MAIRVVLADDSAVVRVALGEILNRSRDIELVATAEDEPTLLDVIEETRPDVVVTDVRMPPVSDAGLRVAERLATEQPNLGVVILSQSSDLGWLSRVSARGRENRGWVIKERAHSEGQLVRAIKAVYEGRQWIDPSITAPG